ncbi:O-antigen ligase family protein [Amycolatopsis anabasis]|uniref:O-antigen ligase family protein n=1 Tax=Amycolatopsis anabasis TaxID=1840409 RepID=UPI00131DF621|nr:O-antigen ligase family protein [Amycolatopsis anabasis]
MWLIAFACLTVVCAPVEGYLTELHAQLAKLPALLLVGTWAVVRLRQRRAPSAHPVHAVLLLLGSAVLASAAVHAGEPFTVEYAVRWLSFVAVAVVLVDVASREVPPVALCAAAVGGAVAAGTGALHSLIAEEQSRAAGPLEDPNDLAYVLVTALPLLVAIVASRTGRGSVLLAGVAATVVLAGILATFSRGGMLALLAATGWLTVRRVLPARIFTGAVALVAGLTLIAVTFVPGELARATQEKAYIAQSNVDARELRWQAAARMLVENPLYGVGPGGFRSEYVAASDLAELAEQLPVAHNIYLETGAELGIPGLVLLLGLAGTALVASERALRRGADRRFVIAVQASLIAALVASCFLSEQHYLPLWFAVALACAIDLLSGRKCGNARPARDQ